MKDKIIEELEKAKIQYVISQNKYNNDKGKYFRGQIIAYEKVLKWLKDE